MYLEFDTPTGKQITFDEIDGDKEVCIEISDDYSNRFWIKKEQAEKVIKHLKEQFNI